jgi:hypothetical protein
MKRSTFLIITAVIGLFFGGFMLLASEKAASQFGLSPSNEIILLLRVFGGFILSTAVLNFMVRHHVDTNTLKSVFVFNIIYHLSGMLVDMSGIVEGIIQFQKTIGGNVVHLFVIIGCSFYISRMKIQ